MHESSPSPAHRPASAARPPCASRATARARHLRAARAIGSTRSPRRDSRGRRRRRCAVVADVTQRSRHDTRSSRSAVERFGRLDVMICNAGFGIYGAIDADRAAQMRRLIDVNYHRHLPRGARRAAGVPAAAAAAISSSSRRSSASAACRTWARTRRRNSRRSDWPNGCAPSCVGTRIHVTRGLSVSTETEFFDVMTRAVGLRHARRAARGRAPSRSRTPSRGRSSDRAGGLSLIASRAASAC